MVEVLSGQAVAFPRMAEGMTPCRAERESLFSVAPERRGEKGFLCRRRPRCQAGCGNACSEAGEFRSFLPGDRRADDTPAPASAAGGFRRGKSNGVARNSPGLRLSSSCRNRCSGWKAAASACRAAVWDKEVRSWGKRPFSLPQHCIFQGAKAFPRMRYFFLHDTGAGA